MISPEYAKLLNQAHEENPDWGTSAKKYAPQVLELIKDTDAQSLLDYGCGKCTLAHALAETDTTLPVLKVYDPGIKLYSGDPQPADVVACIDVLEHIEPEHLEAVLKHIKSLTLKAAFLVISTQKAKAVLPDGRNAHLIVKPMDWWRIKLHKHLAPGFMVTPFASKIIVEVRV